MYVNTLKITNTSVNTSIVFISFSSVFYFQRKSSDLSPDFCSIMFLIISHFAFYSNSSFNICSKKKKNNHMLRNCISRGYFFSLFSTADVHGSLLRSLQTDKPVRYQIRSCIQIRLRQPVSWLLLHMLPECWM